ncbi:hypothetical protein [Nostoc sp. CmiVER01]|uniref:hypothetical protein n=1 Tax=Nostoc sp. CmiVER01 TaxID=3075384 RepID=UPI002AD4214F|nr:hypothetical protein [Nostoc sp. CmiVER01]MDZ8126930.1 hypothetical protein [Nostoc sp. CmiVER01]
MQKRTWQPPEFLQLNVEFVTLKPLIPERDVDNLYAASHSTPEKEAVWNYLFYGPFDHPSTMKNWIKINLVSESDRKRQGGREQGARGASPTLEVEQSRIWVQAPPF